MRSLEANRALATKFGEAWNTHNMRLFDEIFHQDAEWHVAAPPHGNSGPFVFPPPTPRDQTPTCEKTIMNKQEMMEVFDTILSVFNQFSIEITSIIAEGDTVVAESQGRAVAPQNGRIYNNMYCYVMKVRDGKIALFKEYQNTLMRFD
jgi:ketosteroid isomerase-like protein